MWNEQKLGFIPFFPDLLGGVMVNVLALSAEGRRLEPWPGQTKDLMKLVVAASPLSTQHKGVRAKTGWLRVRIMCLGKVACLTADC